MLFLLLPNNFGWLGWPTSINDAGVFSDLSRFRSYHFYSLGQENCARETLRFLVFLYFPNCLFSHVCWVTCLWLPGTLTMPRYVFGLFSRPDELYLASLTARSFPSRPLCPGTHVPIYGWLPWFWPTSPVDPCIPGQVRSWSWDSQQPIKLLNFLRRYEFPVRGHFWPQLGRADYILSVHSWSG